jgi:hypothetical protein
MYGEVSNAECWSGLWLGGDGMAGGDQVMEGVRRC